MSRLASDILALIERGAPAEDIQAFLEEEGVTISESKAFIAKFSKHFGEARQQMADAVSSMAESQAKIVAAISEAVSKIQDKMGGQVGESAKQLADNVSKVEKAAQGVAQIVSVISNDVKAIKERKEPEKPKDYSMDIYEVKKQVAALQQQLDDLLTMKRVPVFDKNGEISHVVLKKA